MTDYSQNQEQGIILSAVGREPGRFLDIGAYDGNHFSNTRCLLERGWTGVMVEPALESFLALLRNHGDNPKVILVHALIGLKRGFAQFWDTPGCVSTTVEGWFQKWQSQARYHPPFVVPAITLEELLAWLPGPVDFLSIDAEGISAKLFLQFPLEKYLPKAVCVEYDDDMQTCQTYGEAHGYKVVQHTAENLVMVHD